MKGRTLGGRGKVTFFFECRGCELKMRAKAREERRSKHEELPVHPEERPNPVTAGDS